MTIIFDKPRFGLYRDIELMKIIVDEEGMRTPLVLVCGQGDVDGVAGTLMNAPGTAVVGHEFDGQVVRRWVSILRHGELWKTWLLGFA